MIYKYMKLSVIRHSLSIPFDNSWLRSVSLSTVWGCSVTTERFTIRRNGRERKREREREYVGEATTVQSTLLGPVVGCVGI